MIRIELNWMSGFMRNCQGVRGHFRERHTIPVEHLDIVDPVNSRQTVNLVNRRNYIVSFDLEQSADIQPVFLAAAPLTNDLALGVHIAQGEVQRFPDALELAPGVVRAMILLLGVWTDRDYVCGHEMLKSW